MMLASLIVGPLLLTFAGPQLRQRTLRSTAWSRRRWAAVSADAGPGPAAAINDADTTAIMADADAIFSMIDVLETIDCLAT